MHSLTYTSRLSPDADPTCIATIVRHSRAFNRIQNITGILVFDGERFFQYLEGEAAAIKALAAKIAVDRRHVEFEILHQGPAPARRFGHWSMAYAVDEDGQIINHLLESAGDAITAALESRMQYLDLDRPPVSRTDSA